jgi:hypothetical protein
MDARRPSQQRIAHYQRQYPLLNWQSIPLSIKIIFPNLTNSDQQDVSITRSTPSKPLQKTSANVDSY